MWRAFAACLAAGAIAAAPAQAGSTSPDYLHLAEAGLSAAHQTWWDAQLGWWDGAAPPPPHTSRPLASLWAVFPVFEAVDAVAIASPTPAHLAAVRRFANGAERYFDPYLQPVAGYTWYPNTTIPNEHTYFDDNGWWEIGFLDAYRATGSQRYLHDAELAFHFIAAAGWDAAGGGGVWWETLHLHKTSEPLAAEIYTGFALYRITGDTSYLDVAQSFLAWADTYSWNADAGLYARSATDPTVMDYVEGMMIGARLEQCQITSQSRYCDDAEQLADAATTAFARDAPWTPPADAIYLRFLLDLYRSDGNSRWLDIALENAQLALTDSSGRGGLYLRAWNGGRYDSELLSIHAATTSLFAWIAADTSDTAGD